MSNKLTEVFKIISFYDDYRWESQSYNLINFFRTDLEADIKILTHWLCFITDRQMPFQRIWDIGGFVFSELIYEVKKQNSLNILNPENEYSFVRKEDDDDKYAFISKSSASSNSILNKYDDIRENGKVKFKSRFFPSDYLAVLYTLVFLDEYDFSFSKFIKEVYCEHKEKDDFIKRILFSLYLLTYYDIGQPKSSDLSNFADNIRKAYKRKNRIIGILSNPDKFRDEYNIFLKDKVFKQKRAWCSLRDYLKSPEFIQYFKEALSKETVSSNDFDKLLSNEALTQLELPGDVWNNNSIFRNCILKDTNYKESKMDLNKIIREYFDKTYPQISGYPEQFDITFDFVPRMCEKNNCDICPIDRINNKENNFNRICLKNENMYCPVILVGCNYKNHCRGSDKCKIV